MGGGGGGGYYKGNRDGGIGNIRGGDGISEKSTCLLIQVSTPLNSVQVDLLKDLEIGECLSVEDDSGRLVVLKDGKIVGSLTPLEQAKIIACITEGFVYKATVISRDGASCIVKVVCRG